MRGIWRSQNALLPDLPHVFPGSSHVFDLPDGTSAWVCCALARAVCLDLNKQAAHSPEARLLEDIFGADGIQKT
jgi:hypothetical protein